MRSGRREGFTLTELLVVIAIIGILAAMVFPVFARARESARRAVCLSNVKNAALAVQMYLADYDETFPPWEHRQEVIDYMEGYCPPIIKGTNPFLPWHVVLDPYVRNRDTYRCPSSKLGMGPGPIIPDYQPGGYWGYLLEHEDMWGWDAFLQPCLRFFPPGWGGDVTDSIAQQRLPGAGFEWLQTTGGSRAPELTIGFAEEVLTGVKAHALLNPSNTVVAGDVWLFAQILTPQKTLFEVCRPWPECAVDPAMHSECPWASECGLTPAQAEQFQSDPSFRDRYLRHLGGSNFAFADGHARWWNAYTLMDKTRPRRDQGAAGPDGCPVLLPLDAEGIYGFVGTECPIPYEWPFVPPA